MENLPNGMNARYVDFCTDFAFKKFFGTEVNKELLIHFLNSLLELDDDSKIQDVIYLNPEQIPEQKSERKAVFDVYCLTNNGERVVVEMQRSNCHNFKNRSLFYSTFPIREQSEKGNSWEFTLSKIYVIGILDFSFDNSYPDSVITKVQLMDNRGDVFNDVLNFVYIELPKFRKNKENLETFTDMWLFLIKNLYQLQERPIEIQSAIFDRLFATAELCNLDDMEYKEYSRSLKEYRDWKCSISRAIDDGRAEGLEKGFAKGFSEGHAEGHAVGLAEGRAEGIKQNQLETAKAMLDLGVDKDVIVSVTKLTYEEIENLK